MTVKDDNKSRVWFIVTILFAICLTILTLSHIALQPSHILPGLYGDGAKNDFTYLYQCLYGKGFWFEGMNYPYGEHIVYTDGQPILTLLLTSIKHINAGTALTILWWLVSLSYVLSVVFIYKILVGFKVSNPVAMIFAGLITIFSPQVFRIEGHYAMSYVCVVPILFYLTINYHRLSLKKYCVGIFILGIIAAFLHPYFAAMILVWGFFYIISYVVLTRGKAMDKVKHIVPLFLSIIALFGSIATIMYITDPVKDRPVSPYGMLTYITYKHDVVTSKYSPIWKFIDEHNLFRNILPHISDGGEGYSYIGLVAIGAILLSIVTGVIYLLQKKRSEMIAGSDGFSPVWLMMACCGLLFSMGVPYIWHMEWLLDSFPFLKQFRSLGRFSWIFFYIITIYAVVVIHTYYTRAVARQWSFVGYSILVLSVGIWSYEASGYVKFVRNVSNNALNNYDDFFSLKEPKISDFLEEHHIKANDFQAILILSFYHIGSDKLWVADPGWRMTIAGKASYQLHLPIVDVMMSRTSLSQTKKQVKIAAGPFAEKPMLKDLKNNKPFLLFKYDNDELDVDQAYLLQAADHIGHFGKCELYAFYPERQLANDKRNADSILQIVPFMKSNDTCVVSKGEWYVDHMDGGHADKHFFGTGAVPRIVGNDSIISIIPIKPLVNDQEYEFSSWFLLSDKSYSSPYITLEFLDSAGNVFGNKDMLTKESIDNDGMWFRGAVFFRMNTKCRAVRCKLYNDPNPSYLVMDELMLRPTDALIISRSGDGSVMVNNHLLKKGK